MNKKFLSVILFSTLMVGTAGTFTSCKDYDDDIEQINNELSGIKSQIEALEGKIKDGKWITSVAQTANGLTITLSDGTTYDVTNGKDGAAVLRVLPEQNGLSLKMVTGYAMAKKQTLRLLVKMEKKARLASKK